jgi:tight adherence protein C
VNFEEVTSLLGLGASGCGAATLAFGVFGFALVEPLPTERTGARARARREAFGPLGLWADPLLRRLCRLAGPLIPERVREVLEQRLEAAGDYLGLDPEDIVVLSVLTLVAMTAMAPLLHPSMAAMGLGALLGASTWPSRLSSVVTTRVRAAERELPTAIDLMAMCMDAGVDFGRAVELVASADGRSVVALEFERLLRDVRLGSTRRDALMTFGRRLPAGAVREFVSAAVQAERMGTPLSEVLAAQATTARARRSVAAEEAAARAGVLMIMPLMLFLVCIVLLLVGPFAVSGGF